MKLNPRIRSEIDLVDATGGMTPEEIGAAIYGNAGGLKKINIPNDALKTIPVHVFESDSGTVSTDFDPRDWEPRTFSATYYVDQSLGNDANSGLSEGLATASIKQALTLIAAAGGTDYQLIINAGYYDRLTGWAGVQIGNKNIVVRCRGDVTSSCEFSGLSWSDATNGAYSVSRSAVGVVYDKLAADYYGDFVRLEPVADSATCIANPGTMYTNGTTLWVHRSDGLLPTFSNTMVGTTTINVRPANNGRTIIYGMKMWGGPDAISCNMGANVYSDVILVDCETGYSTTNATDFNGARYCISKNVVARGAGNDGFNYQAGASGLSQIAVEINCTARGCGLYSGDENNNASSMHDDGVILRVNGLYLNSRGPVINDIDNVVSWNIACKSGATFDVSGYLSASFSNGSGSSTYLHKCVSLGGAEYDAYAAGNTYIRDSATITTTAGDVVDY